MATTVWLAASALEADRLGGHRWVYLNWALGLRDAGCDVIWLEQTKSWPDPDEAIRRHRLAADLHDAGLDVPIVLYDETGRCLQHDEGAPEIGEADLLLSIDARLAPATVTKFRRTALVDIDPGLLQRWVARGEVTLAPYDRYFTTGETVGTPTARFPTAVLAYHHIGEPPWKWWSWYYLPERVFAQHLGVLGDEGWVVVDSGTLLAGLDEPERLPDRTAVLTFDDGYRSFVDTTLPLLRVDGLPSVLFVATDHVGGRNRWDDGVQPSAPLCTWTELRALLAHGVDVQSHGASHRSFADLDTDTQAEEAARSRSVLEANLGRAVEMLAYPFGDPGVIEAVRVAGYRAAFTYPGEPVAVDRADRFRLPRVAMGPDTDLRTHLRRATGPTAG